MKKIVLVLSTLIKEQKTEISKIEKRLEATDVVLQMKVGECHEQNL